MMTTENILLCDDLRRRFHRRPYDPIKGIGCTGRRAEVKSPVSGEGMVRIPEGMLADESYKRARKNIIEWQKLRCRHDFEYWCARCVIIKQKTGACDGPFILNEPQRRVLSILERDRIDKQPMRIILLKARQWGGSTLVQMYMAWIQTCHCRNWNSLICAHVKDTASGIRGMYTKLLENYPAELWEGDEPARFKPYERAQNIRTIAGRQCRVSIGSSENQDAVRGADYAMAHLSETAFWPNTPMRSPQGFIQAICGGIGLLPYSLIAIESTANGAGNYFHNEWLRSKEHKSDKHAIFVPWYEIDIYRLSPPDPAALAASMNDYERHLWNLGLDLEQIWWYRVKASEYSGAEQMKAEFPTDDAEAFINSGNGVFSIDSIERLRRDCMPPGATGEIDSTGHRFTPDACGKLHVWELPQKGASYIVAVDVGGRSAKSDWSVIAVLKTGCGTVPEIVAQWRDHADHDILARKAALTGRFYNTALLVIESNTFETAEYGGVADSNLFVLSRLAESYPNVYRRRSFDRQTSTYSTMIGFHTNRATKVLLISGLIEHVREHGYIERDHEACNEMAVYEQRSNGSYGAKSGYHDDILMTRAIALHVAMTERPAMRGGISDVASW